MSAVPHTPRFKAFVDRISARIDNQTGDVPAWVKRVGHASDLIREIFRVARKPLAVMTENGPACNVGANRDVRMLIH